MTVSAAGASNVVVDLGGTNVRFAVADHAEAGVVSVSRVTRYALNAFMSFDEALDAFQRAQLDGAAIAGLAVGAAGLVSGGIVKLTNAPWSLNADDLSHRLGGARVVIVNDLQAVGRALGALTDDDVEPLRTQDAGSDLVAPGVAPRLAVNVGTGFGASACHAISGASNSGPVGVRWLVTATEAGHMTDGFKSAIQSADTTVEEVCSGAGLLALANAYLKELGGATPYASARDVCARNTTPAATQALDRFGWTLGRAVRDLVLAHGAWSGVYLTGSVADAWWKSGQTETFWSAYEGESPMRAQLDRVPMYHITVDDPALIGLAAWLTDPV
ncbi:MAG: glucokinase [Pseudomonadota bacterium]